MARGIGRHSAFAQSVSPDARITLVEMNQQLRDYCLSRIPGAVGYERFETFPLNRVSMSSSSSAMVSASLAARTRHVTSFTAPSASGGRGHVLIESGNFASGNFHEARHEIEYDVRSTRLYVGYATRDWLETELSERDSRYSP